MTNPEGRRGWNAEPPSDFRDAATEPARTLYEAPAIKPLRREDLPPDVVARLEAERERKLRERGPKGS